MEISIERKQEIKQIALYTFKTYVKQYALPINLSAIIKNIPNVRLIAYSTMLKKNDITYDELIIDSSTRDAYVVCNFQKERYCIYANDLDSFIITTKRYRWNIAHELGHVMLEHHYIAKQKKLRRYYVDDETYDYLEKEADYYAQLILVPHACLCSFNITSAKHIALLCKISDAAAKRRFYDYQIWHSHMSKEDNYDNSIFYLFFDYSFKRKCKKCKHIVIQRYGKYCIFCGKKQLEWSNEKIVYYPKLPTYDNGKLKMCPVCKNEETSITGQYCQICSARLVNTCSNFNCNTLLPSNARFCPLCGSRSVFFNNNFLSEWNALDGFMVIPDGIEDNSSDIDEELPFN